eukprot:3875086-Rhodomonas_salina.1
MEAGGQISHLWRHYFSNTQGLIFVVDSNDRASSSLSPPSLRPHPLLFFPLVVSQPSYTPQKR